MFKLYILLIISCLLQACSSKFGNNSFLNSTSKQLQTNYKIAHADLIIQYDLTALNKNKCLYANDLGLIINDQDYNKIFLQKFKKTNFQNINQQALNKSKQIKELLLKLNSKYKFLSQEELSIIKKPSDNTTHHINELVRLNKLVSHIPVMLPEYKVKVTSHYGMRRHPKRKRKKLHNGIDLQGHKASPIYASANGLIAAINRKGAYGNMIEIKHSNKFTTKYAHLKKIYVTEGDTVIKGQIIGLQGISGNSTGEHLHFEILLNNKPINPFDFISHACNC
jgi:murein DD-endopeptidase MepM/ murein hydrolase activator NlpD